MKFYSRVATAASCGCFLVFILLILERLQPIQKDPLITDLPEEIELVEWEGVIRQPVVQHSNKYRSSACSFQVKDSDMTQASSSDLTDWSFTKRRSCPPLNYTNYSSQRQRLVFSCTGQSMDVHKSTVNTTSHPFSVPFGSTCLGDVIDDCCIGKGDIIPNVVHYVFCGKQKLRFIHFVSLMSAVRFIKPCMVLFHGDTVPFGNYWNYFVSKYTNVIHVKRPCFYGGPGHKLGYFEHGTDIMRIQALLVYGGIYLDWDEIVLRPIDRLRKYDYVQGFERTDMRDGPILMGSQFLMAKKNASFLQRWYESYVSDYNRESWIYNALQVPAMLTMEYPELIHIGKYFTRPNWDKMHLIFNNNYDWSGNYAMHLFQRFYKNHTDETVIRNLNTTMGAISRHVLFGNKELCFENHSLL